jgi:hypothetical protein
MFAMIFSRLILLLSFRTGRVRNPAPQWLVAVVFLLTDVSAVRAQTASPSHLDPVAEPLHDDQPAFLYYGKGPLPPEIRPFPPSNGIQVDDLSLPSPTPPSPTPVSTPVPTATANPTPTALPSASPPVLPSPPPPPPVPPPPRPAPMLPRPVSLPSAIPVPANPGEVQRLTPAVEVWRTAAILPQVPSRHGSLLDPVYVTGTEQVSVRVRLDPLTAGKHVRVIAGKGFVNAAGQSDLTISMTGEYTFTGHLASGFDRGHVIIYSESVKTVLPVFSVPAAMVQAKEAQPNKR